MLDPRDRDWEKLVWRLRLWLRIEEASPHLMQPEDDAAETETPSKRTFSLRALTKRPGDNYNLPPPLVRLT